MSLPPTEAALPGYRPCVGIMLISRDGRLFLGERRGAHPGNWQMPQGGIDKGETPLAAARRELLEEVGTDRAELLAESRLWHHYAVPEASRPAHWRRRFVGQSQKWLAFRYLGEDADFRLDHHTPEFERWRWASAEEALALIVPFKRDVYAAVLAEFRPFLGVKASFGAPPV